MTKPIDPVELAAAMMRRPSVTPVDAGALDVLQEALESLGFTCQRLPFAEEGTEEVDNLYARRGTKGRNFCFAGHTDVVPPGDVADWSVDPFEAAQRDGVLIGRGACDMKGAIACFVAAAQRFIEDHHEDDFSLSLLITGDEEGPAVNGTKKVLQWLVEQDETLDACLVGEPSNPTALGEMIKVGRRGSMNTRVTVHGTQGHAAYPHLADNPITRLIAMLAPVNGTALDGGNDYFDPSTANVTSIDTGNEAGNVIPASVSAKFNIRFNTEHNSDDLIGWLEEHFNRVGGEWTATWRASAQPFVTPVGSFTALMQAAIESVTGQKPVLSTSGGTSDARFITNICPVAEFGLVGQTMHQVDEHVDAADIDQLAKIYHEMLVRFFKGES